MSFLYPFDTTATPDRNSSTVSVINRIPLILTQIVTNVLLDVGPHQDDPVVCAFSTYDMSVSRDPCVIFVVHTWFLRWSVVDVHRYPSGVLPDGS